MLKTTIFSSPIGPLEIGITHLGLKFIRILSNKGTLVDEPVPEILLEYKQQVDEYFAGMRVSFQLPLDLSDLPPFHRDVLKMVYTIPFGKTRSYKQIAMVLGNPKAVRAVGQANGKNPIPIVIPCHRVIGNKGELTGYAYGLDIKMQLLKLENPKTYVPQIDLFDSLV